MTPAQISEIENMAKYVFDNPDSQTDNKNLLLS